MDKKYSFWREVYELSRQEVRRAYPIWWDAMRLAVGTIYTALAVALAFYIGGIKGQEAFNIILWLFGSDLALWFILWVSIPVISFVRLPWVVERHGKEQKDLLNQSRSWDRLARGELIELRENNTQDSARIEIYNGEDGNPFNCNLYVMNISGRSKMNQVELNTDSHSNIHVIPKKSYIVKVVHRFGKELILNGRILDVKFVESGEYFITTHLEGSFLSHSFMVEKTSRWKLIVDIDKNSFAFEKVEEG